MSTDLGGEDAHRWIPDATDGSSLGEEPLIAGLPTCWASPCGRSRRVTTMLMTAAEAVMQFGEIEQHAMPFERAVLELYCGRALRRAGQRRVSVGQLRAARDADESLARSPHRERREGGLPPKGGRSVIDRKDVDSRRLTPQESAVAKLVATGMDHRHVARELFIGIPTVKFHLTHIYTKLGISSRLELGARPFVATPAG